MAHDPQLQEKQQMVDQIAEIREDLGYESLDYGELVKKSSDKIEKLLNVHNGLQQFEAMQIYEKRKQELNEKENETVKSKFIERSYLIHNKNCEMIGIKW